MIRRFYAYILYIILRLLGRNVAIVDGDSSFPFIYRWDVVEFEDTEPRRYEAGIHDCGDTLCVHIYLGDNKWHTGMIAKPLARVTRIYANPLPMIVNGRIHIPIKEIRKRILLPRGEVGKFFVKRYFT